MAENNAVLTDEEKGRIRYHLGYGNVTAVSTIALGIPARTQPSFLVDGAMNLIPASQVQIIRRLVGILDGIEGKKLEGLERLAASQVGEITMNKDEQRMLDREYVTWAKRLADTLLVPLNPYSDRWSSGLQSLSTPVRN